MKRCVAVMAVLLAVVLRSGAQDAFTPLIYAEEVAQTMKMVQQIQEPAAGRSPTSIRACRTRFNP